MDIGTSKYFQPMKISDNENDDYIFLTCRKFIANRPGNTAKYVIEGDLKKVINLRKSSNSKSNVSIEPSTPILNLGIDDVYLNAISERLMNPSLKKKLRRALMLYLYSNGFLTRYFNQLSLPYDVEASDTDHTPLRDYIEMDIIDNKKELAEMMTQLDDSYPGLSGVLNSINLLLNDDTQVLKNAVKKYANDNKLADEIYGKIQLIRTQYMGKVRGGAPCKGFIEKYKLGAYSSVYTNYKDRVEKLIRTMIGDDAQYILDSDYMGTILKVN